MHTSFGCPSVVHRSLICSLSLARFVKCEEWRKATKLDETVPTWDYPEKAEIFKFYPQYYHKTDKVGDAPGTNFV